MIKIKTYRIGKRGARGSVIGLPRTWVDDLKIGAGDLIDFYRDEANRLILIARKPEKENG